MKKKKQIEILEELIEGVEELGNHESGWSTTLDNGQDLLEHIKSLEE